jgi:hypothetical protein
MINTPYTEQEIKLLIEQYCISNKIPLEFNFDIDDYGIPHFDTSHSIDDVVNEFKAIFTDIQVDLEKLKPHNLIEIFSLGYKKGLEDGKINSTSNR